MPTADTARPSWEDYGEVIVCDTHEEMLDIANELARTHAARETTDRQRRCRPVTIDEREADAGAAPRTTGRVRDTNG